MNYLEHVWHQKVLPQDELFHFAVVISNISATIVLRKERRFWSQTEIKSQ